MYPPDADFVVLADPDGNLFCVATSAESELWFAGLHFGRKARVTRAAAGLEGLA